VADVSDRGWSDAATTNVANGVARIANIAVVQGIGLCNLNLPFIHRQRGVTINYRSNFALDLILSDEPKLQSREPSMFVSR
jgi:hypothetical protein